MSRIPRRSPFQAGDRVQMHGFPGAPEGPRRGGFTGTVQGGMGSTLLHGVTDDGRPWMEHWGALQRPGEPNLSAAACTCCPRPARAGAAA